MLVRISTELGFFIPGGEVFFSPMSQVGQSIADGACAVLLPRAVTPYHKMGISIAAAILVTVIAVFVLMIAGLTNYYAGVGAGIVAWQIVLMLLTVMAAGIAVLYAHIRT